MDDSYLLYVKFFHQATKFIKTRNFHFVPCESTAEEVLCECHTMGFLTQTQKLELLTKQIVPCKVLLERFHFNGDIIGFHPQTLMLGLCTKQLVPCERTVEEVSFEWSHHRISSIDSEV